MSSLALALPLPQSHSLAIFSGATVNLCEAACATLKPTSREAYFKCYKSLASFLGLPDGESAVQALVQSSRGQAHGAVLAWLDVTIKAGLSASTANLRLSAVMAVLRVAQDLEMIQWSLRIKRIPGEGRRDTRGPGAEAISQSLRELGAVKNRKCIRDRAILALLFTNALRRAELVGLDVEHVDLDGGMISILGKGRRGREPMTIPPETVQALRAWLAVRGDHAGPLFENCDRSGKTCKADGTRRLSGGGLWSLIRKLGLKRPHAVRHSSITESLTLEHGNVSRVQRFSRHMDVNIVQTYNDNREDVQGQISRKLAAAWM
jgi:integrase/recombinase XerC